MLFVDLFRQQPEPYRDGRVLPPLPQDVGAVEAEPGEAEFLEVVSWSFLQVKHLV